MLSTSENLKSYPAQLRQDEKHPRTAERDPPRWLQRLAWDDYASVVIDGRVCSGSQRVLVSQPAHQPA